MRLHVSVCYDFTEYICNNDISLKQMNEFVALKFCSYQIKLLVLILFRQITLLWSSFNNYCFYLFVVTMRLITKLHIWMQIWSKFILMSILSLGIVSKGHHFHQKKNTNCICFKLALFRSKQYKLFKDLV